MVDTDVLCLLTGRAPDRGHPGLGTIAIYLRLVLSLLVLRTGILSAHFPTRTAKTEKTYSTESRKYKDLAPHGAFQEGMRSLPFLIDVIQERNDLRNRAEGLW